MKILGGGVEQMMYKIDKALTKKGYESVVFGTKGTETKGINPGINLPAEVYKDKFEFLHKNGLNINNVMLYLLDNPVDLIHNHGGPISTFSSLIKRLFNIPILNSFHSPPNFNYSDYEEFLGKNIHYTFVSQSHKEDFAKKGMNLDGKVVHNGIEVEEFPFSGKKGDYLLFLSRINKIKGAETAIEVAEKTGKKLILAGRIETEEEEKYFKEIIKPRLNSQIQYYGQAGMEDKKELLKNALSLIAPINWEEPFGLMYIEAMATGTPCITFNRGATREIITSGKDGFICEDLEEMIESVEKVGNLDRDNCRKKVEEKFNINEMIKKYEKIYEDIISKNKKLK